MTPTHRFTFVGIAPFSAPGSTWPTVAANSLRHARLLHPELALADLAEVTDAAGVVVWVPGDGPWVDGLQGKETQ
jgi:hypothetical protein